MSGRRESDNVGLVHGNWGEDVACEYLRTRGLIVMDRNVRPCEWDRRYEIDIIAYDQTNDTVVFVEVKQHKSRSERQHRLRSICHHKKELLLKASRTWLRKNNWSTGRRFDVVEVYGDPESGKKVEIDHLERVQLFEQNSRFVNWAD